MLEWFSYSGLDISRVEATIHFPKSTVTDLADKMVKVDEQICCPQKFYQLWSVELR